MNLEEQFVFARRRCRELAKLRLALHQVRRSLLADGLDPAIVDEAVEEYETLLTAGQRTDRLWWRLGALLLFLICVAYVASAAFQPKPMLHKGHAFALGFGLLALLQFLMPMMPRR